MDICYIANANSPHTMRWIGPVAESGHRVRLFSYVPVKRRLDGVEVIDLTSLSHAGKSRFFFWANYIRRELESDGTDIVHAHQIQSAGFIGSLTGSQPFVVSAWGSDVLVTPFRSLLSRYLTKWVMRKCDALVVPSGVVRETALSLGMRSDRIVTIPWAIDQEPFRPRPEDRGAIREAYGLGRDAQIVLSPRGMRPLYNHDVVLRAMRLVLEQNPKACLVFVDPPEENDYSRSLLELVRVQGMEDIVRWLPYQWSMKALGRIYRMSDVLVSVPSSESYGFTVYESIVAGCPAVVSDLPVFETEFEDGVHLLKVPIGDVKKTAAAIEQLLADADLRQRVRLNCVNYGAMPSTEQQLDQTERLYRSLIR